MNITEYLGVSSRFIRRISVPLILAILVLLVIIGFFRNLSNITGVPASSDNTKVIAHTTPNNVSNVNQLKMVIKQELPFIYQPSSTSRVLRVLLVFYPNDQETTFQSEFRWLYLSWTDMMKNEPSLWRTDLIVYASEYISFFQELGCVFDQIRVTAEEKPRCRVFPYVRIKDRQSRHEPSSKHQTIDQQRSKSLHQHLRAYGYIDSINTVFEYNSSFSMYDFVLRTDMDCFLTENFGLYIPYNNSILVGRGGYSTEFNNRRLKRIARDMNWTYADRTALGSTWYGPPSIAHRMADFTLQAMTHLTINEFTTPEREHKLGVMLWPEWHYGVLLLYGGHLAINHLIASEHYSIDLADKLLDQGVTSKDRTDIRRNHRLHLHCWHGDEPFSKFAFKEGKYNQIQPSTLANDTSASGYAMRTALESKLMTLPQLKQKLLDVKK